MLKKMLVALSALSLTACGTLFDKDNTPTPKPLTSFKTELNPTLLWSVKTGSGADDEHLKVAPAFSGQSIYTVSAKGTVTSVNKMNGNINWRVDTDLPLTSGAGAGDGIVVAGSRKGDVIALSQVDGRVRWEKSIPSEILANPVISNGKVVVKSIDGYVRAFSTTDGHSLWAVQQTEPGLILRGSSTPAVMDNDAIVGFANGRLIKLNLYNGQMMWSQTITYPQGAFAIERMIDIDADPVIHDHHVYAATYQGKIASLGWSNGNTLWSHDLSSYTGMTADADTVYVSDAKSFLWSFNANSGLVNWRMTKLEARNISAPASIGNYLVVGDSEGYLHWINKQDGRFVARLSAGGAIVAAPVAQNNVLYALTNNGYLVAYKL